MKGVDAPEWASTHPIRVGMGLGAVSLVALWYGFRARSRAGTKSRLIVVGSDQGLACEAVRALPALIDCRHPSAEALAKQSSHPLVRQLVAHLANWRPRKATLELKYQHRLWQRLRQALPDARPQWEVRIGRRERVDLVLGESLLVELKARYSQGDIDRAMSQARRYVREWGNKGPLMMLFCNADSELARERLEPELMRLRSEGLPVVGVVARG